jgi:hypothetical protein
MWFSSYPAGDLLKQAKLIHSYTTTFPVKRCNTALQGVSPMMSTAL